MWGQSDRTIVATNSGYTIVMKQILLGVALMPLAAAAHAAPIEGRWQNPKDSVIVNVARCGDAYCGKVAWASAKAKADARKGGTANLVGTSLMSGFTPDGTGGFKGKVLLPKRGIHASGTIRHAGSNALIVKGCAIAGLICKEQRWTRVN